MYFRGCCRISAHINSTSSIFFAVNSVWLKNQVILDDLDISSVFLFSSFSVRSSRVRRFRLPFPLLSTANKKNPSDLPVCNFLWISQSGKYHIFHYLFPSEEWCVYHCNGLPAAVARNARTVVLETCVL